MRAFEYRHVVAFAETNLVGNVYFTHHLAWQGRCRELFIRAHVPEMLAELQGALALVTSHCSCDYLDELQAFDEVVVRMTLADLTQGGLTLDFATWRIESDGSETLVARGTQRVACMRRRGDELEAAPVPDGLVAALRAYER